MSNASTASNRRSDMLPASTSDERWSVRSSWFVIAGFSIAAWAAIATLALKVAG